MFLRPLLLSLCFFAPLAFPLNVVQTKTVQTNGTGGENDTEISFNETTNKDDAIWVVATVPDYAGVHTISVTDSQGNVFEKLSQENDENPGYQSVAQFSATGIKGGKDTITVHWNYDDYKGVMITELSGVKSVVGHSAADQHIGKGKNNVTTPAMYVSEVPALLVAVSMNTSGGSSDLGGSGYGYPSVGTDMSAVSDFWSWGVPLAIFATKNVNEVGDVAPTFSAPDKDDYVTVTAVFD